MTQGSGVDTIVIMSDNIGAALLPAGHQIRALRVTRGWSLNELARRAGTSAPALHRHESGWDRFEVATLRRIAAALGARLEVRLVPDVRDIEQLSRRELTAVLSPLFWDRDLAARDLDAYPDWVLVRVLMFGNRHQVACARRHFGDEAIRRAVEKRGVDARTRNYWRLILGGTPGASEGPEQ